MATLTSKPVAWFKPDPAQPRRQFDEDELRRLFDKYKNDEPNPAKEDPEYVVAIQDDVRWLGFDWHALRHASDYFDVLYLAAEKLIRQGDAFVCDLTPEQEQAMTADIQRNVAALRARFAAHDDGWHGVV